MGKRGPKAEHNDLKLLKGNPGKQALNTDHPKPAPVAPPCPDYLQGIARETWEEWAPKLEKHGLLTELDLMEFRNLCIAEEVIQTAYRGLVDRGSGTVKTKSGFDRKAPELATLDAAIMQIHRLSDRFGLDPISRQSLVSPKSEESSSKLKRLLSK